MNQPHATTSDFWRLYRLLPAAARRAADASYRRMKADPNHSGSRLKSAGPYYSARAGRGFRALAVKDGPTLVWFWIGTHAEYDKLLARR